MYQKIMALGAALLCAAGAHAQTAVQFTGIVDAYAGSMKMAGDARGQSVVNSGCLTTSWFGFKGSEDLGSGLNRSATPAFPMPTWAPPRRTGCC